MHIQELGHIVLFVTDLERSADFYRDTLGFREIDRGQGYALYSGGRTHHELLLIEIDAAPEWNDGEEGKREQTKRRRPRPGLYHIGFKIGDGAAALRTAYRELKDRGVAIVGTADHYVTHSLYLLDPDGNELELYADVSDEWKTDPAAVLQPTRPLDLETNA